MQIKGWVRSSLIDYPGRLAAALFTGGCNFRCPMCHNGELVLDPTALPDIDPDKVLEFLARRAGLLDGVVISGGEPTLQPDLAAYLRQIRELGFDVKLDTNGYSPEKLEKLLCEELVDYVAMDIKAPRRKYALLAGLPALDIALIERSIELLQGGQCQYEFRTTVVPNLLDIGDIEEIAQWIQGSQKYVLQQFRPLQTLDPSFHGINPYPVQVLREMAERARAWVTDVSVRE